MLNIFVENVIYFLSIFSPNLLEIEIFFNIANVLQSLLINLMIPK